MIPDDYTPEQLIEWYLKLRKSDLNICRSRVISEVKSKGYTEKLKLLIKEHESALKLIKDNVLK